MSMVFKFASTFWDTLPATHKATVGGYLQDQAPLDGQVPCQWEGG